MFAQRKTSQNKSTHHARQPFFSKGTAGQRGGSFFYHSLISPTIQKKCAACEAEQNIQPKLTIGQADDQYETEADAVADRVANTSDANIQRQANPEKKKEQEEVRAKPLTTHSGLAIQRMCTDCREKLQRQPDPEEEEEEVEKEEEEEPIQAKRQMPSTPAVPKNFNAELQAGRGQGQSLAEPTRHFFESRFGRDFGDVRIHTDSRANHLARSINAKAFTLGRDVVFGSGEYSPTSAAGRKLLAHELTHVVQQGSASLKGKGPSIQRKPGKNIIQRAVTETKQETLAGLFELSRHTPEGGPTFRPRAQYNVKLEFHPYQVIDCQEIDLTQTAQPLYKGTPTPPHAAFRSRSLTAVEGRKGTAIDQDSGNKYPYYTRQSTGAVEMGTQAGRRTGSGRTEKRKKAFLTDNPGFLGTSPASSRDPGATLFFDFETCAICKKGAQEGVYYGCVSWGYDIDAADKFTEHPFKLISKGTPSANFLAAAKKWNAQTVPVVTEDLPLPTHKTKQRGMTEAELKTEIKALKTTLKALPAGHVNIPQITFEIKVYQDILNAMTYNKGRGYNEIDIKAIQVVIGASPNGVYDFDTIMKIKKWQVENSLPGDGRFGPKSKKKFDAIINTAIKANKAKGFTDEQVKKIQRKVGANDDGDWGPKTVKHLIVWQEKQIMLIPNGIFGLTSKVLMFGFGGF